MTLTKIIKSKVVEDGKGIIFVKNIYDDKKITYKQLLETSTRFLGFLQSKQIKPKDELVILLKENDDFMYSLWAGILGGMISIPITLDSINDSQKLKLIKVWNKLKSPYLIGEKDQLNNLIEYAKKFKINVEGISKNFINIKDAYNYMEEGEIFESRSDDIAFVQFSSGSTGDPKGIILRHKNIISNIEGIIEGVDVNEKDNILSWLPLTHNMGLIAGHIMPLFANINQVNMRTIDFLQTPNLWLEKASEYKSTLLQSPNFGYKHALSHMETKEIKQYNLSNVRVILNGGEQISPNLCKEFLEKMSGFHLNKSTIYPAYGLAEGTLAVTIPHKEDRKIKTVTVDRRKMNIDDEVVFIKDDTDINSIKFVDLGYPIKNSSVRITNLDCKVLKENTIGFIEIKGESVTSGYYNNIEETEKVINSDNWLNTGDLGFINNGRLIVIGRYKDVVLVNGLNYYANDLERVIEKASNGNLSESELCIAEVNTRENNTKDVAIFIEYTESLQNFLKIEQEIKKNINQNIGIEIKYVVPVNSIPKTTSGKKQRFSLVDKYEKGEFIKTLKQIDEYRKDALSEYEGPRNEVEEKLSKIWSEVLKIEKIGINDNFFELGGHSLKIPVLISKINKELNKEIQLKELIKSPTINSLSKLIEKIEENKYTNIENKYYEASSAQKRIYMLQQFDKNSIAYNMPLVFEVEGKVDKVRIETTLKKIITRHEALRTN